MLTVRALTSPLEWDDPGLRSAWTRSLQESGDVNVVYASPEWFDSFRDAYGDAEFALLAASDATGTIRGVVPIRHRVYQLPLDVSGRVLLSFGFVSVEILGSIPTLAADAATRDALLQAIRDTWPRCQAIYLDVVPLDSPWNACFRAAQHDWAAYEIDGARPWFLLDVPPTPEAFLSALGSKSRGTLRRKVKRLGEVAGGDVQMTRYGTPETVQAFLEAATVVSRTSWQHRVLGTRISTDPRTVRWFEALARHGLLRGYLLTAGTQPHAFVVGYQYQGVFHYAELGYDPALARESPGTVLLFLLIQDLCAFDRAAVLNFGMGDAEYKRRFGTRQQSDDTLILIKRSLRGRAAVATHRTFRAAVRAVRSLVKGRPAHDGKGTGANSSEN